MSPAIRLHRRVLPGLLLGMFLAGSAAAEMRAVPFSASPVIDGIAGPWAQEWENSLLLWTPHTDPFDPHWLVARIQRDDSRLFLAAQASNSFDYALPARIEVRIRTASGSGPVPSSGDFALRIFAQTGLTQSVVGDGIGFTATARPLDWQGAEVELSSPVDGELASFDVSGRCTERVAVLANSPRSLRLGDSRPLAAGVHFVRLRAGAEQRVQRVVVLP